MTSLFRAWLLDPTALLFILSLIFLLALIFSLRGQRRRLPRWILPMLFLWVSVFLVFSAPVVVNPLIALLEDPYLNVPECPKGGSHLVVLGGGVDSRIERDNEFERMAGSTLARINAAARLATGELQTRIIVAGGAVRNVSEAAVMSAYLEKMGIASERIVQESQSSNTRENALNVVRLLDAEQVQGAVRLITSAMHMPRALKSFRRVLKEQHATIEICPVSVDVEALKDVPAYAFMPQTTAISRFDPLLHEVLALLVYRFKGWL